VHRAEVEERQEIEEEFLCKKSFDLSYQNPLDARSAWEIKVCTRQSSEGITLQISVSEIQESHFPGGAKGGNLQRLRKSSKSERSKLKRLAPRYLARTS
jgi:hypothetical protein